MSKQSLDFLTLLLSIDSQSKNIAGVNQVQRILGDKLSQMGGTIHYFTNPLKISGDLLLAKFGKGNPVATLVAHADTVLKNNATPFLREKDRLTAPGIADNKGGLFILLKGVQDYIAKVANSSLSFQVLISPNEELGSLGWHEKFREIGKSSPILLGFEPAMGEGHLIGARRGNLWYQIQVYGIGGHTGREGRHSVNATHELAAKITKIHQLEKNTDNVSLNMGSLKTSPEQFNMICNLASAKLDFRFSTFEDRDRLHKEIIDIISTPQIIHPHEKYCYSLYSIEDDCPPLESNPRAKKMGEFYKNLLFFVEKREFEIYHSGGAADINYMAAPNSITLDGLGPIGGNLHTTNEFVVTSSLFSRAETLTRFLTALNGKDLELLDQGLLN